MDLEATVVQHQHPVAVLSLIFAQDRRRSPIRAYADQRWLCSCCFSPSMHVCVQVLWFALSSMDVVSSSPVTALSLHVLLVFFNSCALAFIERL
ncbi:hypothetical protein DY000_02033500 [Brassica cretica]|uniref:Uncharacterized protein n=1 Tax=Brassica cretica TaxID=69181 RepID=A0ABQ7DIH3_BRACR|nr:hypothetical protein DY000_02033500 [Brassica cretica]